MSRLSPHTRNLMTHPHVVEMQASHGGLGLDYDRMIDWLARNFGGPSRDRWRILGLRVYFQQRSDADEFAAAWRITIG